MQVWRAEERDTGCTWRAEEGDASTQAGGDRKYGGDVEAVTRIGGSSSECSRITVGTNSGERARSLDTKRVEKKREGSTTGKRMVCRLVLHAR